MKTSIEFLLSHMWTTDWVNYNRQEKQKVIEQAKEMEKEQIVQAAARGYLVGEDNISLEDAKLYGEEYYEMTFKTK